MAVLSLNSIVSPGSNSTASLDVSVGEFDDAEASDDAEARGISLLSISSFRILIASSPFLATVFSSAEPCCGCGSTISRYFPSHF